MTSRQQEAPFIYDAEIEYLQGDKNSYIDTGISCAANPDKAPDVEISFHYTTAAQQVAFGTGSGSNYYAAGCGRYGYSNSCGALFRTGLAFRDFIEQDVHVSISPKNRSIEFNGSSHRDMEFSALNENSKAIFLFAIYDVRNDIAVCKSDYKIYYVKVSDPDGKLLFDGIPVRKGDNGYMFDKVSRRLFGNSGEGLFILGPDVI